MTDEPCNSNFLQCFFFTEVKTNSALIAIFTFLLAESKPHSWTFKFLILDISIAQMVKELSGTDEFLDNLHVQQGMVGVRREMAIEMESSNNI